MTKIDNYLAEVHPPQRKELERIRKIIKQSVPDTEETISYGMPTLKYKSKNLIHFAVFKDHMSIFPGSHAIEVVKPKLKDYKISKGTVQFTLDNPLKEALLKELIKVRLYDIDNTNNLVSAVLEFK